VLILELDADTFCINHFKLNNVKYYRNDKLGRNPRIHAALSAIARGKAPETIFSDHNELNAIIIKIAGRAKGVYRPINTKDLPDVNGYYKTQKTEILLCHPTNENPRHRPGKKLETYTKLDEQLNLKCETYGDSLNKENTVILRNIDPVKYPKWHHLAGEPVKVIYLEDGTARLPVTPEEKERAEVLHNEWASNVNYSLETYNHNPTLRWTAKLKLELCLAFKVSKKIAKEIKSQNLKGIISSKEKSIGVYKNGWIVITTERRDGEMYLKGVNCNNDGFFEKNYSLASIVEAEAQKRLPGMGGDRSMAQRDAYYDKK